MNLFPLSVITHLILESSSHIW